MADLSEQFQMLADSDMVVEVIVVLAAFMIPTIARNVLEPNTPFDVPDEAYGVLVAFGATFLPEYREQAMLGGGLYSADKAAERFGLKQRVTSVGA
jgi:hypothetical protein